MLPILMGFLLFYITYPDEATARRISDHLLEQRLVACANLSPMQSSYWWEGTIQREEEWVSVVKTRLELEPAVEAEVLRLHPYDTPCILRYEVRANAAYEAWIVASTTG